MSLNIPAPRVPLIDPRTGYVSREWYLYFLSLSGDDPEEFGLAPIGQVDGISGQGTEQLGWQISHGDSNLVLPDFDLAPPQEHLDGEYMYAVRNLDDTHATINTGKVLTWTSVVTKKGIDVLPGALSQVRVSSPGTYRVQGLIQVYHNTGATGTVYMWLRKNGFDIGSSMVRATGVGVSHDRIVTRNWMVDLSSGDYIELVWAVSDITFQLLSYSATAMGPSNPAAALSINKVS